MKKCDFENCQYPMCDMECGLSLSELAESLVEENEELREEIAKFNDKMWEIRKLTSPYLYAKDYTPTCPLGHTDCLNDPAYLRKHNHNAWENLGRPINCMGVLVNEETGFCSNYKER